MSPRLHNRRVVEVPATRSWESTLSHRVYSCPDTYDHVLGATGLILQNNESGARVPLEVTSVVRLAPDHHAQVDALFGPFRRRAENYLAEARNVPGIIEPGRVHRLYFLGCEPWPAWLQRLTATASHTEWAAILSIFREPDNFFEWPQIGELLWPGSTRGNGEQRHHYPAEVAERLRRAGFPQPDERNNGPAIMAFLVAGGWRPNWGSEGWPIHHIYDGTAPIIGDPPVVQPEARGGLHAVKDDHYFTHSGGLVAAHPVAHHLAHQSTLLKWLLRREAFLRFGFDPDTSFPSDDLQPNP